MGFIGMCGDIFVFGSNKAGVHGSGAAMDARRFYGAVHGVGEGFTGLCYALPTKMTPYFPMGLSEVRCHVEKFLEDARNHADLRFRLTRVGCGLAGFSDEDIAPMFFECSENVVLPGLWQRMKDGVTARLIVAGGREITDRGFVFGELDRLTGNLLKENVVTEVCGEARGVDVIGREWAELKGLVVDSFPANWDAHGKAAGMMRNKLMANHGTHLVAFWDGESRGTKQMIDVARSFGLVVRVVKVVGHE